MGRLWIILLILASGLLQTSCENRSRPSLLIIAVDSLPFHASLCTRDAEEEHSGFQVLCRESVRFTHAVTTSTMSVPALASLLTGLYPFQHDVRHNGGPGLSPQYQTFAEAAVRRGYRTGFFSGGPPVWRRMGLHQGFEIFDDNLNMSSGRLFRPFAEIKRSFESWLQQEVEDRSFVSVLYVPDLSFTDTVTETANGELRSLSYDSQLDELDETLGELFALIKKAGRWNDTIVTVVGLNGLQVTARPGEIEPVLLNSENTQVSMFVKPARKPRDEAIRWTIDRNVNLADLGHTFFELTGNTFPVPTNENFPTFSLMSGLTSAQPAWPEDRPVLMENGWSAWQGVGDIRAAVLKEYELLIYDDPPRFYNTLTDRLEVTPLPGLSTNPQLMARLKNAGFRPWVKLPESVRAIFQIPALNWLSAARAPAWHRQLISLSDSPDADRRILRWAAQSSLEQKDWNNLARIGKKSRTPLWTAVAERNLGKKVPLNDVCLGLLLKKDASHEDVKACPDELFLSLYAWSRADAGNKDSSRRRFLKGWEGFQQDLRILKANAGLGLPWLPSGDEDILPTRTSLALALPEMKKFAP